MESSTVAGLRSRSRSKTPFLRSSCDRESCTGGEDHTNHKSGRKTPVKRSTPVKQLQQNSTSRASVDPIEEEDEHVSPPAYRTRQSTRTGTEKLIKTSDYSSEESPDRWRNAKEIAQNQLNYRYEYERVSTSTAGRTAGSLSDLMLSPIHGYSNITADRSTRFGSPASVSACSTDSSFAEQALADASTIVERDPEHSPDHLPYRLYKMAGEYWNKYPKTDYTYSPLSKDRVELAPGQIAVPNMSRRSLTQFRIQGPNTSPDEVDMLLRQSYNVRRKYTNVESSDDESPYHNGGHIQINERWRLTSILLSILTSITTTISSTVSGAKQKLFGPAHRYPYTDRTGESISSRVGAAAAAPFYWTYTIIKKVITTTVTTITETISPPHSTSNHVTSSRSAVSRNRETRRWPWLLLLLLPLVGYGCYRCEDMMQALPQMSSKVEEFKPPQMVNDSNLAKRIAALEAWAMSVDSKFKIFDQKLSKLDNIEATIESHTLKHLQQNIIQIFNLNNENSEVLAGKLKSFFDEHYVSKEKMRSMSEEMHERLKQSHQPEFDEQKILAIVQEYLAVYERRQKEVIIEKVKEYVKEVRVEKVETGFDVEAVKKIVAQMLEIYDADKTGLVDYALESAGGQVISTKCTELYQIKTKQYFVLGLPVWWVHTSPRNALTPGAMPAECWAFQGFPGYLVIRTYAIIEVTGFSMEHMSKLLAVEGKIESAPKNFSVYGLRDELDPEPHLFGDYMYDANGTSIQYFPVQYPNTQNIGGIEYPVAYDIIELRVESNHGNPTYTCVYRFRVHGNPLSDIRRATEDSLRESDL